MCGLSTCSTCFLEPLPMGMEEPGFDFTRGLYPSGRSLLPRRVVPLVSPALLGKAWGHDAWHHHVPGSSATSRG